MWSLDDLLSMANKLMSEGNYIQAIEEYGKVLELVFRELYKEYFLQLPHSDREKALDYEKKLGKSVEKFTIGEWIGLLKQAHFFDFIKNRKGIKISLFFTPSLIDILNKLRVEATHPKLDEESVLGRYDIRSLASFMRLGVECLLCELGILPIIKTEKVQDTPSEQTCVTRVFGQISREDILKAAKDPRIVNYRYVSKYVVIDGKKFPPKGLLAIASGVPTSKFTTNQAERVLEKLGFKVYSVKKSAC